MQTRRIDAVACELCVELLPPHNGRRHAGVDSRALGLVQRERRAESHVVAFFLPAQLRASLNDGELLLPQLRS